MEQLLEYTKSQTERDWLEAHIVTSKISAEIEDIVRSTTGCVVYIPSELVMRRKAAWDDEKIKLDAHIASDFPP